MSSLLIINAAALETRVSLIEGGVISEFYIERKRDRGLVGNIYEGIVLRVLPGMQAAFVDIGQEKAAFLYVSDVFDERGGSVPVEASDDDEAPMRTRRSTVPIEDRLVEGQRVLVQVAKEPIGTKGARITSHVSLPGRYLVYMPTVDHIGISRRIESDEERERLRTIIEEARPEGAGFIVRTASEHVEAHHLRADMEVLLKLWQDIQRRRDSAHVPALLFEDYDLILRATRDLFTTDLDRLVIDNQRDHERIVDFCRTYMPDTLAKVELYTGREPIFDAYGVEVELGRALSRKVWLKSGGYIVIDHTEALTSIDVNTGRYVGKNTLEDTIVKINLEAVEEIVYQLKLRSIGGIIIIDLIDMEKPTNRESVYRALTEALKTDKAKTNVLKISEFGLIQMTRKRVRESVVQYLCEECPYCEGKGYVKSRTTVANEILREIQREAEATPAFEIAIEAHPEVAALLQYEERDAVRELEQRYHKRVHLIANRAYHVEHFEMTLDAARRVQSSIARGNPTP